MINSLHNGDEEAEASSQLSLGLPDEQAEKSWGWIYEGEWS